MTLRSNLSPIRRALALGVVAAIAILAAPRARALAALTGPEYGDGGVSAFYRWSGALPGPGILLRQEAVPAALIPPGAAEGRRLLYSSTSGWGQKRKIYVSGELFLPQGRPPAGGWPVIAWAHGTTGTADVCAPSWMGRTERDTNYLGGWLKQGYAVVTTDYEGLGTPGPHPYMGLQSEAYGMLDAIRAAHRAFPVLAPATIIVGQSQGAHAAYGAGLLAPAYAPDVKLKAVVVTGLPGEAGFAPLADPPSPVPRAALADPDTPRDGVRGVAMDRFDPWMVVYLSYFSSYRQIDPSFWPEDYLTPLGQSLFDDFKVGCHSDAVAKLFATRPLPTVLLKQDPSPLEKTFVPYRRYPDLALGVPLFVGIGLQDEQTAPEMAFNVVRGACARGVKVSLHYYPGMMHSPTVTASRPDSDAFIKTVFDGGAPQDSCGALAWPGRQ